MRNLNYTIGNRGSRIVAFLHSSLSSSLDITNLMKMQRVSSKHVKRKTSERRWNEYQVSPKLGYFLTLKVSLVYAMTTLRIRHSLLRNIQSVLTERYEKRNLRRLLATITKQSTENLAMPSSTTRVDLQRDGRNDMMPLFRITTKQSN